MFAFLGSFIGVNTKAALEGGLCMSLLLCRLRGFVPGS